MDEYLPDILPPDINIVNVPNDFQHQDIQDVQVQILEEQHPVFADVILEDPDIQQELQHEENILNIEVHIPDIQDPAQQAQHQVMEQNNPAIIPPLQPEIPAPIQIQDELLEAELVIKEYADSATLHLNRARKREHTKQLLKERSIELPRENNIIIKPNQRIVINSPLFLGNAAHIRTKKYVNLEIGSFRTKLTADTLNQIDFPRNRRCATCKSPVLNMEKHRAAGSFAPKHIFSTLDDHLQLELLFTCTLTDDNLGLKNKFNETLKVHPHRDEKLTNKHIENFSLTGKNVPETISEALATVGKFPFCGEHKQAFSTIAAFLLHHVTEFHTVISHICVYCKMIVSDSPLKHHTKVHGLDLNKEITTQTPPLHKIAETLQNCKISDIILEDYFNFQQSTMIRKTLQGIDLHQTIPRLLSQFTATRFRAYDAIRKKFPNEMATTHSTWFKSPFPLHQMDMLISFNNDGNEKLYGVLSMLERLLDGTPPTSDASEFLKYNNYEIMQSLVCARVQYEHRELEIIKQPEDLKTGSNFTFHLQPGGPSFYSNDLKKLQDTDLSIYKIITVGQRMMKTTGLLLQEGLNVLNLSNCEANLLPTSGYSGLTFFENENGKISPIFHEQDYLQHVRKVLSITPEELPTLIEFDILGILQKIPVNLWEQWLLNNLEKTVLYFLVSLQGMLNKPPPPGFKPRNLLVLGQHTLFHQELDFTYLINLTNQINLTLSRAGILTEVPILLPTNLVGINIRSAISLRTMPRTPVFLSNGENSEYTVQSIQHLVQMGIDILDLKEDTTLFPAYRSHMVYFKTYHIVNIVLWFAKLIYA